MSTSTWVFTISHVQCTVKYEWVYIRTCILKCIFWAGCTSHTSVRMCWLYCVHLQTFINFCQVFSPAQCPMYRCFIFISCNVCSPLHLNQCALMYSPANQVGSLWTNISQTHVFTFFPSGRLYSVQYVCWACCIVQIIYMCSYIWPVTPIHFLYFLILIAPLEYRASPNNDTQQTTERC